MSTWTVVAEPKGKNPGVLRRAAARAGLGPQESTENMGGSVIYLQSDSGTKEEVSRVAFVRRAAKNPDVSYRKAFKQEVARAKEIADTLNELNEAGDVLA